MESKIWYIIPSVEWALLTPIYWGDYGGAPATVMPINGYHMVVLHDIVPNKVTLFDNIPLRQKFTTKADIRAFKAANPSLFPS